MTFNWKSITIIVSSEWSILTERGREMKGYSIYDLAFGYLKLFQQLDKERDYKQSILNGFRALTQSGWTDRELIHHLLKVSKTEERETFDLFSYFQSKKPTEVNLLTKPKVYYHNLLRLTSPPPVIDFDYNTGEAIRKVEPYFLEMRASFSIRELVDYFKSKTHLYVSEVMPDARIIGAFKWLIKNFELELILFMIDEAEIQISSGRSQSLKNPSDVHEFFVPAKLQYEKKRNACKLAGGDQIVPRRRKA